MTSVDCKIRLEEIQVGDRVRRDLGDLPELAASIQEVGLLHPIAISPEKKLIAGQRRLEAVRQLGWEEVPVHVVTDLEDITKVLQAEGEENACRKPFTPSEAAALGRKLEELEKTAAKVRQAQAGPEEGPGQKTSGSGKLPEADKGDTRDKVGTAVGMSGKTYEKVKKVVEAAEKEPDKYGPLVKKMDESGKVDGAYRELMKSRESEATGSAKKRRHKEDIKPMLDKLLKKVKTMDEKLPLNLEVAGKAYAQKLSDLARVLNEWSKILSPQTEEDNRLALETCL